MRKYNNSSGNRYNSTTFTTMDACFVLKNVQTGDAGENRISFDLDEDLSCALNHDKLTASGLNPFVGCQNHINGGVSNPTLNTDSSKNNTWLNENFSQFNGYGREANNPFSLEVVNTGGCHSRAYAIQDWQDNLVLAFEQAKVELIQCHRMYYEYCKTNQDTMCTVIEQAKYLDEVQEYWSDIDQSILVNGDSLSTNLAVVSEDRLEQLKAMANNRRKPDTLVVSGLQNQA
jgi:hypothetical protein